MIKHLWAALALSGALQAQAYVCQGVVKGASLEAGGDVIVQSVGTALTWPRFCNVNRTANGLEPAACKGMYATLLTAQLTGRPVTVWIHGDANDTNRCSTLTPWQYVQGFYFLTLGE